MDRELFERIRQSGRAALAVANRLPLLLEQLEPNSDDSHTLAANIQLGLKQSTGIAIEAERADPRLSTLARDVVGLWKKLAEKMENFGERPT
jgi:hypothetical protein